ncbi:hypothetical protein [Cognataquiflexum nitidum]|nr:hypothetical protein [Cognataquiflexum nitidum]
MIYDIVGAQGVKIRLRSREARLDDPLGVGYGAEFNVILPVT